MKYKGAEEAYPMPDAAAPVATRLIDTPLAVGESIVWDDGGHCLWFVDILAPAVFRLDPKTRDLKRWEMPTAIGSLGLCPDGRLVVALRSGVHLFDPRSGKLEFLVHPEPDRPGNRLNDGKVGPDGCFWVGSMDDRPDKEPVAALYRVTPEGTSTKVADGLTVSNGLAWSADGRTMFHSDSRQRFIAAYDFDPRTSAMSNRRILRTMTDAEGRPDGAAADSEGYYWSAGVSAGRLNRIAPDGMIDRQVALPAPAPTMPCFGGPGLTTMYVTSLQREGQDPGSVFALDVGIAGAPIARFGEPLKF
jgi:sugar lactone lactonase YvrE